MSEKWSPTIRKMKRTEDANGTDNCRTIARLVILMESRGRVIGSDLKNMAGRLAMGITQYLTASVLTFKQDLERIYLKL
jgi:hypothetical protein